MEIGPPKRVIEVDPASIPVPETFPDLEPVAPLVEPTTVPEREPEPVPSEP